MGLEGLLWCSSQSQIWSLGELRSLNAKDVYLPALEAPFYNKTSVIDWLYNQSVPIMVDDRLIVWSRAGVSTTLVMKWWQSWVSISVNEGGFCESGGGSGGGYK